MVTNDYRILIQQLRQRLRTGAARPNPTMGVSPSYLWWSRRWLWVVDNTSERVTAATIPDFLFDRLTGYTTQTEITRGYRSAETAVLELLLAIHRAETEL